MVIVNCVYRKMATVVFVFFSSFLQKISILFEKLAKVGLKKRIQKVVLKFLIVNKMTCKISSPQKIQLEEVFAL